MWEIKPFNELSLLELQTIYQLRVAVFVVEQQCPYQDVDGLDLISLHGMYKKDGILLGYFRLIPDGAKVRLGRVLVAKSERQQGIGKQLVAYAIEQAQAHYPNQPIHAQAQAYLQTFYAQFGFEPISGLYLEDNIPHLDMLYKREG